MIINLCRRALARTAVFSMALTAIALYPDATVVAQDTSLEAVSVSQSSTSYRGAPTRAVDGNTNGVWRNRSVTHTRNQAQPWWTADLGLTADLSEVTLWNRTDCCKTRLSDFYVLVSDSPFSSGSLAASLADSSIWSYFHAGALASNSLTIPVNTVGRYVRIQLQGTDALSLAEVVFTGSEFVSPRVGELLPVSAAQSSTAHSGVASRAIDGNTNGVWRNRSVTHTRSELQPWWTADLGTQAAVDSVEVWNRVDGCCSARLSNFYVLVSETPFTSGSLNASLNNSSIWSAFHQGQLSGNSVSVPVGVNGRYIRIQLQGTNPLSLAEVLVSGSINPDEPEPEPVPNQAPVANAGVNQTITEGQNVTLNGAGSRDSDGSIASYVWSEGGVNVGAGVSPVVRNLGVGTHRIVLLVTDNDGATDTDTVVITVSAAPVQNIAPIADAGADQTIQQGQVAILNGSGSRDSDGRIVSYAWSNLGSPVGAGEELLLSGLGAGVHTVSLEVTDDDGAQDVDTVRVTVNAGGGGVQLLAVDDEATVEVSSDGSSFATIYFSANDQGAVVDSTFEVTQYGSDGTNSKGWVRQIDKAQGVVYYHPYARDLIIPMVDYFTYQIKDAEGNRSSATVKINILPPAPPAGCDAVESANQTVSLLLVGNSLMNEIQSKLGELLKCRGYRTEMATSNPGGYWLHLHDTNERTASLIAEGYDLTLLQEQSSGITTHSVPYEVIASLKAKIEAAGGEMGFYQTWGLQDREPVKTEAILSGYETIANYFDAPIVHIGRAFDYFYILHSESPPFSLHFDYAHPTQEGKALISYVLYAYLTGRSPVDTPLLGLDEDDALLLQTVAWDSYQAIGQEFQPRTR